MGVLADKIQSFIDSITNATTAMNDDVVAGKTFWKEGVMQAGSLPSMTADAYNINIAPNKEDVNIIFLQKTYTVPTDAITIPRAIIEEILKNAEELTYTDSKDDIFYLPETDGDFYSQVLFEGYWDRGTELPDIALCTDDFLINSTATNNIVVTKEWYDAHPDKQTYFTLVPDTETYVCSIDGNLVPFYDAIPDWALTQEDNGATWVLNSSAVKWIDEDNKKASFCALKGFGEDDYHKVPHAGRLYFPGGIKVILEETNESTTVEEYVFVNQSVNRYAPDGVIVNETLKPLSAAGVLLGLEVTGIGDIVDTINPELENFTVIGQAPIVKELHAYQESNDSNRHVIVVNAPFIFDFKYSTLILVDDGGMHTSGGDTGVNNPDAEVTPEEPEVAPGEPEVSDTPEVPETDPEE